MRFPPAMSVCLFAAMVCLRSARAMPVAMQGVSDERADIGYLDVSSDPPAKIVIDDTDTGKMTPAQHLPLVAGHHKLTLTTGDGSHKRTVGFTIEAGQTTKLSFHLAS